MALKRNSTIKVSRRFQSVDMGNGKIYVPIITEDGGREFELSFRGSFVGFVYEEDAARERLNELAYDAERGLPIDDSPAIPAEYDLEPDATEQVEEVAAAVEGLGVLAQANRATIPLTLADGTSIDDVLEHNGERAGVLVAKWNNFHISAEDTGLVGFEDRQEYGHHSSTFLSGDLTHEGIARLRLLATSGVLTELLGIAITHPAPEMST